MEVIFEIKEMKKMLAALMNGQSSMKQELKKDIQEVRDIAMGNSKKIDGLHESLRYLEDDTPTKKEYKNLEKRVNKIETKVATL